MAVADETVSPQKPQKSWFGRNWWWVLLLVIIGAGVVCAGVCSGVVFYGMGMLKETAPYKMTLDAVRGDPVVIERLGEPIEDDWKIDVKISETNGQGKATLRIPIMGPKGTANVSSNARLINGKWGLTRVEITFDNKEQHVLELDEAASGGLEDPPPFIPEGGVPFPPTSPNAIP
ncbi:MAG: hypothetical protein JW888_14230 [Pirellulales bacterium]|nr:hypothetical protein [Pirellulales bacterium]